jgi:hypothetical protein
LADNYGRMAAEGKAFLASLSDDDSSIDTKDVTPVEEESPLVLKASDESDFGEEHVHTLRSYRRRLRAQGFLALAEEAKTCIQNKTKATTWQTMVWDSEVGRRGQ